MNPQENGIRQYLDAVSRYIGSVFSLWALECRRASGGIAQILILGAAAVAVAALIWGVVCVAGIEVARRGGLDVLTALAWCGGINVAVLIVLLIRLKVILDRFSFPYTRKLIQNEH